MVCDVNGYEADDPMSFEQITFPEESATSLPPLLKPVQLAVAIVSPPEVIETPPAKVEVPVPVKVIVPEPSIFPPTDNT